jgi:hypothetical protein
VEGTRQRQRLGVGEKRKASKFLDIYFIFWNPTCSLSSINDW